MIQNSYSPAFPLKHQQKDMRLAVALGDENAVPMPVAAAANEVCLFICFTCLQMLLLTAPQENDMWKCCQDYNISQLDADKDKLK